MIKPFVILNSTNGKKSGIKNKVVEQRKTELKSILRTFEDLSKKEVERSKKLFDDHFSFFYQEPEENVPIPIQVQVNDDSFFEK